MSALLVKDAPERLHRWLRSEATFNRRSLNQQVLVCLEWCMRTYGEAQPRDPFAPAPVVRGEPPRGRDVAARLASMGTLDDAGARQMRKDVQALRRSRVREFDYACFA